MILVIGAAASGKRTYVRTLGYSDTDMADAIIDDKPVLCNLQDLVEKAPENSGELLPALLTKEVVICNETGSGVIPAERHLRETREATGRLCILLAREADRVIRVVCGIPTVLKG